MTVLNAAWGEPVLAEATADVFQFERTGYFCRDSNDSTPDHLVFNRTVSLRDTWARIGADSER